MCFKMCTNVNIFMCLIGLLVLVEHDSNASLDNLISSKRVRRIEDVSDSDSINCSRQCRLGAKPKRCLFKFRVSQVVKEDGILGLAVNGISPGPLINVCQHDVVVVQVHNGIPNQELSIHWHGMDQKGTPWMDGVPMITQCPITERTAYKYAFKADVIGTHFYHAFSALQQYDGVYGALIVNQPRLLDPHSSLYDEDSPEEHTLLLGAASSKFWSGEFGDVDEEIKPKELLVNGKKDLLLITKPGQRYRIRLVNAVPLNCPIRLRLASRQVMTAIASDGRDVKPEESESFLVHSGERLDVVISAENTLKGDWLLANGLEDCEGLMAQFVLANEGMNVSSMVLKDGIQVDHQQEHLESIQLKSNSELPSNIRTEPSSLVELSLNRSELEAKETDYRYLSDALPVAPYFPAILVLKQKVTTMNGKNFMYPNSPLLTQESDVKERIFCRIGEESAHPDALCLQNIEVALNSLVEFIVVNHGDKSHTVHFHGGSVFVLSEGSRSDLDDTNNIKRNLLDPPEKDTVRVKSGHYVILRYLADNPGEWIIQCRECTMSLPVAMVLRIPHSIPKAVLASLPKCGNYRPPDILLN